MLHIPVAPAFRPEVCSRSGVVTVGAKTLTPGRGELQNAVLRGLRTRREVTDSDGRPSLGLLAFQPGMCELQGIQE